MHLAVSVIVSAAALPLIGRRAKMNRWYGVRVSEAFASDARWFENNCYDGKLLLGLGIVIAVAGIVGLFLCRHYCTAYDWASLVIVIGGLIGVVAGIHRHARIS